VPNPRKNPITINEGFTCQNCGKKNEKAEKTCKNHCQYCLYSLHVDKDVPGDRASACKGLMRPVKAEKDSRKGIMIFHKCEKCGKLAKNKSLEDDDFEQLIILTQL
jgi:hypothetical protein